MGLWICSLPLSFGECTYSDREIQRMNETNYFCLPPLYALVIGINAYTHYPPLRSAVNDADDFDKYLTTTLHVPRSQIINLRDGEATRAGILAALDDLKNLTDAFSPDMDSGYSGQGDDVAIIVFFAGHGTRDEWSGDEEGGDDYYEALCPVDMGMMHTYEREVMTGGVKEVVKEECEVPAIPDRTIAALVNRLSETRGNNITLIFDCCHSAGASRLGNKDSEAFNESYVSRHIPNPPPLPYDYDSRITSALSRSGSGGDRARGFSGKNLSSHVLLAACGKEQFAYEHPTQPNGVFTYALMKVLNEISVESLTYTSLMHRLNMPKWQNAHCEGAEVDRRLFNHRIEGGDPGFILSVKSKDGSMTLDAGIIQGITIGCVVSVHESNLLPIPQQPNPPLGRLVVTAVDDISSTLAFEPSAGGAKPFSRLRSLFYCRVMQRPTESLVISSNNIPWLESVFKADFRASHSVTIVRDTKAADFVLTLEDDTVYIDHNLPIVAAHIGTRSPRTIPSNNIWLLHQVVRGAINFRFHLFRENTDTSTTKIHVKMEFHELEMSYNDDFNLVGKPTGRDMFVRDPAIIVVEKEKRYGATISNLTDLPLYPHLFYFDPSELSITPWYLPPTGAGTSFTGTTFGFLRTDILLPPNSEFPIGYGEGGVDPWEFMLLNGATKDIGFFKLFATTAPLNLGSISQDSPYDDENGGSGINRAAAVPKPALSDLTHVWDAVVKAVVQVELGGGSVFG